jgi:hypothetical protein
VRDDIPGTEQSREGRVIGYERTSEGGLLAHTVVEVGVEDLPVTVDLGAWPTDAQDPAGPLGLASTPVIVLKDARWTDLATAGALRSGDRPACLRLPGTAPHLGLQLLVAVTEGADVVLVEDGAGPALRDVRALGGRPLAVLPLEDPVTIESYLGGCAFDVHVPLPALEDVSRDRVAAAVADLHLETLHHLVEVDPYPAFAEAGLDPAHASLDAMAAAAAGVLAGRLAAGNRRWRAQVGL